MSRALAAVLVLASLLAGSVGADDGELELKIKAAFLFNFAKFVEWAPDKFASGDAPLTICIADPDPFGDILDATVAGKRIDNHPLEVRRNPAGGALRDCHMLYASTRDPRALAALFAATSGAGVMTIHEGPQALPGGVARLYLDQNRVRFEINTVAAEHERLQISSKLLSVASVVQR